MTQANQEIAVGLALAANTQTSSLTAMSVTALLRHHELSHLMDLNRERLGRNYKMLRSFLVRNNIPYVPCNAGLYIFAKLAVDAETWKDEQDKVAQIREQGVLVSIGRAYHVPEADKGWARIGFSVDPSTLQMAIDKLQTLYRDPSERDEKEEPPRKRRRHS